MYATYLISGIQPATRDDEDMDMDLNVPADTEAAEYAGGDWDVPQTTMKLVPEGCLESGYIHTFPAFR
jgi:hypothetical protein